MGLTCRGNTQPTVLCYLSFNYKNVSLTWIFTKSNTREYSEMYTLTKKLYGCVIRLTIVTYNILFWIEFEKKTLCIAIAH